MRGVSSFCPALWAGVTALGMASIWLGCGHSESAAPGPAAGSSGAGGAAPDAGNTTSSGGYPTGGNPTGGNSTGGNPAQGDAAAGGVGIGSDGGALGPDAGPAGTGTVLSIGGGMLNLEVCAEDIIRVAFAKDAAFFTRSTLATAAKHCPGAPWTIANGATETVLTTAKLAVHVDLTTGAVSFADATGKPILSEKTGGGRTLTAATVNGEATSNIRQEWSPNAGESLYGLGQHQQGLMDIKGYDLDFAQYNTEVFVPFLVSSGGYGILWDNTSFTRFGDIRSYDPIPGTTGLYAASGDPGSLAGADSGTKDWTGNFSPTVSGDYLFRTYSSGDTKLTINGKLVIDHWRQGWLPNVDLAKVRMQAGTSYPLHLQWTNDGAVDRPSLLYKTPPATPTTSLWSEVADGVDYYFVYGPALDHVVSGYRIVTGVAPMMPRWAYGFWQCRERYTTQQESLDVLQGFRDRSIPIDNIVQDWQYWKPDSWGSHEFDATRFPDPVGWIKSIHDTYHARLMISVWPKFYTGTANFAALKAAGYVFQPNLTENLIDFVGYPYTYYDAFNPAARKLVWSQVQTQLFNKGVDAWWLDGPEPDIVEGPPNTSAQRVVDLRTHMTPTALGSGSRMLNAFSLVNSQGVYEGQRTAAPNQRVFILTRNAFAGQQRFAAATWSGDITSTWTAFRKQIPAGLGFSISGIPYWTMDSGGFAVPTRFSVATPTAADTDEWRELNTRWFEYATFVPLMRVHGQAPLREMWQFGGETSPAYLAQLKFDRLRYRLLPYLYSLAGAVTQQGGTLMRPLVMDFQDNVTARTIADQFMLGPAFLVSPVTTYQARTRSVYLPDTAGGWYDFWTGAAQSGGQTIQAAAAFDAMPVHVRAGSIVPTGPELMYTAEKPADPITLWIYAGADGMFTLYEDDGLTYDYEKGSFTRIPISWSDASRKVTIGARQGSFPGMPATRTFQIVVVSKTKATGFTFTPQAAGTIAYSGVAAELAIP